MGVYLPANQTVRTDRCVRDGSVVKRSLWGAATGLGLLLAMLCLHAGTAQKTPPLTSLNTATAAATPVRSPSAPRLFVQGTHVEREFGYVTVLGEVSNISAHALKSLEVVVEFFDASGALRRVETALIELPTLPAGQASPFRVQTRDEPDLTAYRIRFRHLLGSIIPSRP